MEKTNTFKGVRCSITMHRTLYLPEQEDNEQLLNLAKSEIVLPHNALAQIANILQRANIQLTGLDLKDWNIDNVEYNIIDNEGSTESKES